MKKSLIIAALLASATHIFAADRKESSRFDRYAPTTCLTLERKGRGYDGLDIIENNVIDFYSTNIDDIRTIADELQKKKPNQKVVKELMKKVLSSPVNLVFDYKRHKRQLLKDIKAYQEFIHGSKRYSLRSECAVDHKVDLEQYKQFVDELSFFFK